MHVRRPRRNEDGAGRPPIASCGPQRSPGPVLRADGDPRRLPRATPRSLQPDRLFHRDSRRRGSSTSLTLARSTRDSVRFTAGPSRCIRSTRLTGTSTFIGPTPLSRGHVAPVWAKGFSPCASDGDMCKIDAESPIDAALRSLRGVVPSPQRAISASRRARRRARRGAPGRTG